MGRSSLVAQMVKNLPATAGDPGLTPGSGRCPGEGNGYPLQYSCLENSVDRGAWWATVHGVTKSENDWETNSNYLYYQRIVNKEGLSVSFLVHYTWALVVFWPLRLCCNRGWIWDTAPGELPVTWFLEEVSCLSLSPFLKLRPALWNAWVDGKHSL